MPRTASILGALALLAGCALPPNTALRDWSRTASVLVSAPAAAHAVIDDDGSRAMQASLSIYLYALGVVAAEGILTFREDAYVSLPPRAATTDPTAGRAVAELGAVLRAAHQANPEPNARAYSAGKATFVEDLRLRPMIREADPAVQVLVSTLAADAPPEGAYRTVLAHIGAGHALLALRARSLVKLDQRETEREIREAEDDLLRAAARLGAGQARTAAAVAATVQP
jgi:hypothetical protein